MAGEIINRLNVGQVVNVKLTDSSVTNGQNLVDAYNYAKTLTPNGQARSATNRVTIIIQPGNYTISGSLEVNTEFIDIIGLGSQKLDRGAIAAVLIDGNVIPIVVTANNVRIKGLGTTSSAARIQIGSNLPLQRFENCVAGNNSFGFVTGSVAGTFINCQAGDESFGVGGDASGTFINCEAGNNSFGHALDEAGYSASGFFKNCKGGSYNFGCNDSSSASGTFENCTGEFGSFGGNGSASGTFINCVGGASTFGAIGTLFGQGNCTGNFFNCTGGNASFGSTNFGAVFSAKMYNCRLTSGSFLSVTGSGLLRNCIDGNNNIVDQ